MQVAKFGGSSVGSPPRVADVATIIQAHSDYRAVVVSAFQGVTNDLLKVAALAAKRDNAYQDVFRSIEKRHLDAATALIPAKSQSHALLTLKLWLRELEDMLQGLFLLQEISKRSLDAVASLGERFSALLLCELLRSRGLVCEYLDARLLIVTDNNFGAAKVQWKETEQRITQYFHDHALPQIVTGFIASTIDGYTTTLGRGGSDYSAAIFGAALGAEEVAIWTDVNGMLTADPRRVRKAFSLPSLSYEEAMELCHFGAKVIYPPTLQPAMDKKIPIRILNTFQPKFSGTVIGNSNATHSHPITGISSIENVVLLRVQGSGLVGVAGISSRLFGALAAQSINVILISQASSEHSICCAVDPDDAPNAKQAIDAAFALEINAGIMEETRLEPNLAIVSVVGENMRRMPGISGKLFRALGRNGVNVVAIAQGSSELNISVVISREDETKALNAIHDAFFLSETKTLNLFVIGTGLIGSTLIDQMAKHAPGLLDNLSLEVKIIAVANSTRMTFAEDGIPPASVRKVLASASDQFTIDEFFNRMKQLNLPNTIFVDCTASEDIAARYGEILENNVPIVTPNKKAQSGPLTRYTAIRQICRRRSVELLYETSVGAGLPVISTLNDLIRSGDHVHKIEAVLSGTLSFLFNMFSNDPKSTFSEIVKTAKERGYTEPDPRDDLSGLDVARKILILSREAGYALELSDVEVEPLLPADLQQAPSLEEFMQKLPSLDKVFSERREAAQSAQRKLCYMAVLDHGKAAVRLVEVDSRHPFFNLSGSDNIISFTTDRYDERPLVVKGPGAGAEVTAAGVFADIIRLSRHGRIDG